MPKGMSFLKRFVVLGSTGSIGTSSLDVISSKPESFTVVGIAANRSVDKLCEQALRFSPDAVAVNDSAAAREVRSRVGSLSQIFEGFQGMLDMIRELDVDAVINGLVGSVGLIPTIEASMLRSPSNCMNHW